MSRLNREFFKRKTEIVARELLGKLLIHEKDERKYKGIIVETEAYIGPHDKACHASKGKTERTKVMFKDAGTWYVYMIYGFYYCLNIVTENKDYPSAVLIRAVEPKGGIEFMMKNREKKNIHNLTNGPGKLCQAFGIDKDNNDSSAVDSSSTLYVYKGIDVPENKVKRTKRIGVDYAKEWKDKLLRFYIDNSRFVS